MKVWGDFLGPPHSTDRTTLIIKVSIQSIRFINPNIILFMVKSLIAQQWDGSKTDDHCQKHQSVGWCLCYEPIFRLNCVYEFVFYSV